MVDSSVLLDIITQDPVWGDWSAQALAEAADSGRVIINPIIYSEVSVSFSRIEALDLALPSQVLEREEIPYEAAFLAGKCFVSCRRRGGLKASPLPDFFIGAHASVAGYSLVTRDAARFRTYFPGLEIISPG